MCDSLFHHIYLLHNFIVSIAPTVYLCKIKNFGYTTLPHLSTRQWYTSWASL